MKGFPEHGGNLAWARKKYNREDFIDFSANINPLGCPPGVYEAIRNSLPQILHYPDPANSDLKQKLQSYFNLEKDFILIGNGAVEIIYLICFHLKPQKVLILAPTFSEYAKAAQAVQAHIKYLPLDPAHGFTLNLKKLAENLHDVQLFFLCNPNNPTGNLIPYSVLKEIQKICLDQGVFLVVDESFLDFLPERENYSVRQDVKKNSQLLVLHSLTKFFAIPGLRLGCGFGNRQLILDLEKLKDPWNINVFAQIAGKMALEDQAFQHKSREFIQKEKEYLFKAINQLGDLQAFPPSVNFIFIKLLKSGLTSTGLTEKLAKQGILVRNCNTFPTLGENYIRVAVRTREENLKLINALQAVLKKEDNSG